MKNMKILVVEDEKPIADTIIYALSAEHFTPVWCTTGQDALEKVTHENISVIILDIGLPDINGFDLCRKVRTFSALPILFLTARSDEIDRIVGLEIGGDDYIVKPFSPRELVARIRAILRRISPDTDEIKDVRDPDSAFCIEDDKKRILYCGKYLDITKQEYRILATLIAHPGRVFSRDQLLETAWDETGFCSERTVDTYIKTLRSKLSEIDNSTDPIITHRGFGYSLRKSS